VLIKNNQMKIYGIKNCDTMQKAFRWLDENKIPYEFHNYKEEGITKKKLEAWLKKFKTTELINTKGTTFKNLSEGEKESIQNKTNAMALMIQNPSMIKRPLLETDSSILIGFKEGEWEMELKKK
jgi:arsenate reductase